MNLDFNPLLENLQERVVQQAPLKLIHARNTYNVFDKGNVEFNGAYWEWIGEQPLEGVKWAKTLKSKDLEKLPEVFSCKLTILHDHVYYTIYNKKKVKQALQSPAETAALLDRLTDSMKTKPVLDLNQVLTELLCPADSQDNYRTVKEISTEEADINDLDKAANILDWMGEAVDNMLEPSEEYNKGYQKPNNSTWNKVLTNSESEKSLVLIIDPSFLRKLETRFLSDVADDSSLNPYRTFKTVIRKKLPNGYKALILDEKALAFRIINEDGIMTEQVFGSGNMKFGYHITVVGGLIPFCNSWALREV